MNRTIPVRKWYLRLERIEDDDAALAGWSALVRAQGWSPVGEPTIHQDGDWVVVGRVVKYPGLTVSPDVRDAIVVPI